MDVGFTEARHRDLDKPRFRLEAAERFCPAVSHARPQAADELVQHNFDGASVKTKNEIPVYISRLRDKLGKPAIETVLGYGYRLACGDP